MTPTMMEPKAEERKAEVAWTPSGRAPVPSGIAVAAFMSAMLGLLTLALVNLFADASKGFNTWVHSVGKLWMPGAEASGPIRARRRWRWSRGSAAGSCCT